MGSWPLPEKSGEQACRRAAHGDRFKRGRERNGEVLDQTDVAVGKPIILTRGEHRGLGYTIPECDRDDDIVLKALNSQLLENLMISRFEVIEPPPEQGSR